MADPNLSEPLWLVLARFAAAFERFIDVYERRLDFEERRDVRISEAAEIKNQAMLQRLATKSARETKKKE